ncbi:sulfite exporter TauE/SafE family protein [Bacillus sp. V5-8f]|uniref:urease accessory protein UreH domain-containing protein n=1 Tax=Bacillus sp. V5-8f TaxID=2053044 RepID=UPI000C782D47|nr:sulfite exporter TauE/SafE family protein [Bacillus sp. V5-8f]PLT33067.1 urease accessory protein UreH [Bacillus sp. V5-8f]
MEFTLLTTLLLGLVLGCTHALEPDHVAAVSTMAGENKKLSRSSLTGVFWGIGHTFTLFVIGLAAVLLKANIPAILQSSFEFFVGIMLVALGCLSLYQYNRKKEHPIHKARNYQKATVIGIIHGLAGSGAMIVATVAAVDTALQACLYILFFGIGTVIGMFIFSSIIALPFILGQNNRALHSNLTKVVCMFSILYGFYHMYNVIS